MRKGIKVALDPTPRQEQALWSHAGAARFAFNIALLHIRSQLSGCTPVQDKGRADWSMPALRRWWNEWKREIAPWWNENSKEAYNTGLQSLSDAFSNYFDSRSGTRRGNTIMNARTGYTDFRGIHDMKNIAAVDTHRTVWDTMNIGQHFLAYANATYDTLNTAKVVKPFVNPTADGGLQWKHSPQDYFKTLVPDPDQLWNFKTIYQAPGKLSDGVAEASNAIRVGISDL